MISPATFTFLRKLAKNNNRDWFNGQKDQYLLAKENAEQFIDAPKLVLMYPWGWSGFAIICNPGRG